MNRRVQSENPDRSHRLKAINPFLYLCTALGLLPVTVNVTKTGRGNDTVSKAVYRFSMLGFAVTIAMLITLGIEIYLVTQLDQLPYFVSKLQLKTVFYSDMGMAAINILSLLFYRFSKTLSCLNRATNTLFSLNYYSRLPASRYWILIMLAINILSRLFMHVRSVYTAFTTVVFEVIGLLPYSVLTIIVVLNSIVETSYRDINEEILWFGRRQHDNGVYHQLQLWPSEDSVRKERHHRPSILRDLMTKHYRIGNLMLDVCTCFNVDMLASCFNCTVKIILLTYIWYLHTVYSYNTFMFHFMLISDVLFWICIMCITASSCENVTLQQCKETEKILLDILRTQFHSLDEGTKYTIEIFLFQIKCRKIEFSVFDIFVLNRALFYDMLSTCTAFIVVLIQFKSK